MVQKIAVDTLRLNQVCDLPALVEDRQWLHIQIGAALAGETSDQQVDTPQGYRLRIDAVPDHAALLHFPVHAQAVVVWGDQRRLIAHVPTWRDAVREYFGTQPTIVAGLGIRD